MNPYKSPEKYLEDKETFPSWANVAFVWTLNLALVILDILY